MLLAKFKPVVGFTMLSMLLCAGSAQAAGFALYETSARGVAMGGALIGGTDDASTLYHNPSAMTEIEGGNLLFGLSLIHPGMDIDLSLPGVGTRRFNPDDKWFPPPHAYLVKQLNEDWWLGLGLYAPFGLGVEHDRDWPARYNSVETKITTLDFNPNLAYKVNDRLSLAAGLQVMWLDLNLTRVVPQAEQLLDIEGDSIGLGATASLHYRLTDDLSLGLTYISEVKQSVEGDAKLGNMSSLDVEGDVTLPASYSIGMNYTGIEKWNFGVIASYIGWSSYDELVMDFSPPLLGQVPRSVSKKDWDDVWRVGFGAEYRLDEKTTLQAGYVFDQDPVPVEHADYLLPPGDRNIVSLGMGRKVSDHWTLNASYAYLMLRDVTLPARPAEGVFPTKFNNGDAHIVSISAMRPF